MPIQIRSCKIYRNDQQSEVCPFAPCLDVSTQQRTSGHGLCETNESIFETNYCLWTPSHLCWSRCGIMTRMNDGARQTVRRIKPVNPYFYIVQLISYDSVDISRLTAYPHRAHCWYTAHSSPEVGIQVLLHLSSTTSLPWSFSLNGHWHPFVLFK